MATMSPALDSYRAVENRRVFPAHPASKIALPLHYWLVSIKWAMFLMLGSVAIYVVEKYLLGLKGTPYRMVVNPAEFTVRYFGLAHFTLATYMMFTSKQHRHWRGFLMIGLFSLLAFGACSLFYYAGGAANKLAVMTVFFFFLMHALRDEVFFYRLRSNKAISDQEYSHVYRMLLWLQAMGLCLLAALLYPAYLLKYAGDPNHAAMTQAFYQLFPAGWSMSMKLAVTTAPFLAVAAVAALRIQTRHRGGLPALLKSHWPLAAIVVGTVGMAAATLFAGTWLLNVVILTHFTGWFVFADSGIRRKPASEQPPFSLRTVNTWIRRNLLGFWCFHGGLALLFFALIAFNSWGLGNGGSASQQSDNWLTLLFSSPSFYYWTLAHATLGFMPKVEPRRRAEADATAKAVAAH